MFLYSRLVCIHTNIHNNIIWLQLRQVQLVKYK